MKRALFAAAVMTAGMLLPYRVVQAAEGLSLDTVVERWTEALGGRDKLERVELVHSTATVSIMGLTGTLHEWASADGRHHLDLDLAGMFKVVIVFDNGSGWKRDQNGKIAALAGQELEDEISAAYVATMSYLVPGRMPGVLTYEGTEDGTGCHIVRAAPEGGVEVTFYLDPETFLPVRSEQPQQDRTLTASFSEWKAFDGVLFPTHIENRMGNPQHDQVFGITDVEVNGTPTAGVFEKPADKAQDYSFAEGNAARDIPIELNFVHIFLQARVNESEPLWFLLDTGASASVLSTSTAKALGLDLHGKVEGRGAGEGSVDANFVADVTYKLPGAVLERQTAVAIPLEALEPRMGRALDGILGYDMISRFVVEIDYAHGRLQLYDRRSYSYRGKGVRVPIHIEHGIPYVKATVTMPDGRTVDGEFALDTGASMAIGFTAPYTERHNLLDALPKKIFFQGGFGVGGESKAYIGRVSSVDVGAVKFQSPVAGFSQDQAGVGANPDLAGIIGGEILSRCTVIFDYERGEMILEPNATFEDPYDFNMSGLLLRAGGRGDWETLSVYRVMPDSPGAEAGIEAGDVIRTIDGRPSGEFTMSALNDYFKRDGQTVRITLTRDGDTLEKDVRLKRAI